MSKLIPHVRSSQNVTVYLDGKPHIVPAGTPQYDLALAALAAGDEAGVRDAIKIRDAVAKLSDGIITVEDDTLFYDGKELHTSLANRIIGIVKAAGNAGPLIAFMHNLYQNPSKRAVDEVFDFLDACRLPLTPDGHFLAYKKVNSDYTSIHDGTTKNDLGTVVEMKRNEVDEDKNRTCSSGLHFCSKSYLSQFGGSGKRIIVLKINPADVVAIPADYNNAKGRAWRYEVVGELNTHDGRDVVAELAADFDGNYGRPAPKADPAPVAPAPLASVSPKVSTQAVSGVQTRPGQTTLTDAQVREIRSLLAEKWPLSSIAKTVGTSERTVARIRDGETYLHVS